MPPPGLNLTIIVDDKPPIPDSDEYKAMIDMGAFTTTRHDRILPRHQSQLQPQPQPQPQGELNLLDLPRDMLSVVFKHTCAPFVLKLTCTQLRGAGPRKTKTKMTHLIESVLLLQWAWTKWHDELHCNVLGWQAACCGNAQALYWLSRNTPYKMDETTAGACAMWGMLPCLKWMHTLNVKMDYQVINNAAANGHMDVLKWAWDEGGPAEFSNCALVNAAANGHEDVVWWLRGHLCPFHAQAMVNASKYGHLHIMKLLKSLYGQGIFAQMNYHECTETCRYAAMRNHVDCLAWAHLWGADLNADDCAFEAAQYGHVPVLQWLVDQGYMVCDDTTVHVAAANGKIKVLEWARGQGWTFNVDTTMAAASACTSRSRNHGLETLQWLREQGCPWDEETSLCAGKRGNLDMLKWLKEQNAPWHAAVFCAAAKEGHVHVLEWALETGLELKAAVCYAAAQGCFVSCLKWCMDHIEYDFVTIKVIGRQLARQEFPDMAEYIAKLGWYRRPGCPVPVEWAE